MGILPITTLASRHVSRIIARNACGSVAYLREVYHICWIWRNTQVPVLFLAAHAEELDKEGERCSCHRLNDG